MGFPIGIGDSLSVTRCTVDQMVVSVGPYRFHNSEPVDNSRAANSLGRASPPHHIRKLLLPFHPASSNILHVTGVACITVAFEASINCASARPSAATARPTSKTHAPVINGR